MSSLILEKDGTNRYYEELTLFISRNLHRMNQSDVPGRRPYTMLL